MRQADARRCARWLSCGRVGLGITALVAPRLPSSPWIGDAEARRPSVRLFARSLGARDVALGLGPILAMRHGAPVRGWVEAGGLADAGDLVGTLIAWRHLPRRTRLVMVGIIAGSLATTRLLVAAVDSVDGCVADAADQDSDPRSPSAKR